MKKILIYICFFWPFICSCLSLQGIVSRFYSDSIAQIIAYANLVLLLAGIFLIRDDIGKTSNIGKHWFTFYFFYFCFGLLASGLFGKETSIISSFIPVFYITGFFFFLSNIEYFKLLLKVITFTFVISSITTIIFQYLNISLDMGGVNEEWEINRAGGVYADANNAALANIITFLLVDKFFKSKTILTKVFKIILLATVFYSLFITFSTTGLFTFTIVFFITNYKYFDGIKIIFLIFSIIIFYAGILSLKSNTESLGLSEAQTAKIDNIINVLTLDVEKVDNSGRSELFENILYYLNRSPIIGNGVNFGVEMRAHNTYIITWVDAGIITFLFFIFLLGNHMYRAIYLNSQNRVFAISILITLFIFMISLQTVINQPYLIVVFMFLAYYIDYNQKEILSIS